MNAHQHASAALLPHVGYPHQPGYLFDCGACEDGPCVCVGDESLAPCVSTRCTRPEDEPVSDRYRPVWNDTFTGPA